MDGEAPAGSSADETVIRTFKIHYHLIPSPDIVLQHDEDNFTMIRYSGTRYKWKRIGFEGYVKSCAELISDITFTEP